MRLWSLHPSYLDPRGIVATWREGLLARAVLRGKTRGYRNHPQLTRFREHPAPISAINNYVRILADDADRRGYRFDRSRIGPIRDRTPMSVNRGQLEFELAHLRGKVAHRAPAELERLPWDGGIETHALFEIREGPIEAWERGGVGA
jgi:hypothetical protein